MQLALPHKHFKLKGLRQTLHRKLRWTDIGYASTWWISSPKLPCWPQDSLQCEPTISWRLHNFQTLRLKAGSHMLCSATFNSKHRCYDICQVHSLAMRLQMLQKQRSTMTQRPYLLTPTMLQTVEQFSSAFSTLLDTMREHYCSHEQCTVKTQLMARHVSRS